MARHLALFRSALGLTVCQFALLAAQLPSPALLVLNKEDASLSIIDPATTKTVARIPVGEGPHELAVSTDGKLAFASNYGSRTPGSTLSVIDLATQRERKRVDLTPLRRPHGLFFADGKVYVTAEVNRLVARYDPATDKVDWLLGTGQTGTHMVMLNKAGSQLYTANIGSNTITVFDRTDSPLNWNPTVIPVGQGPEALDLSPDEKQLWTAHSRDGSVSVIDLASKKVSQTLSVKTKRSNRLKFTPDGRYVLISDMDGNELIVLDAATRQEVKRLPVGKAPEGILTVPDGSRAYIAVNGEGHLAVLDLKTLTLSGSVPTGGGPDGMAWVGQMTVR